MSNDADFDNALHAFIHHGENGAWKSTGSSFADMKEGFRAGWKAAKAMGDAIPDRERNAEKRQNEPDYSRSVTEVADQPVEKPFEMGDFRISYFSNESGRTIIQIVHLPTGQTFTSSPKRESLKPGQIFPGSDPDIGDMVAVPINQMVDIYETLQKIVKKSQYHISDAIDPAKKEIVEFRGDVFCLAEHAEMFAGNWVQRGRG